MTDITVPQLGESVTEATVGSWQVKTGDAVSKDDVLVELETDKVAVEVRAEEDGVMGEISASLLYRSNLSVSGCLLLRSTCKVPECPMIYLASTI